MLSVSLGFWLQKNLFNKDMNNSPDAIPEPRMVSKKKHEKKDEDDGDKYGWLGK